MATAGGELSAHAWSLSRRSPSCASYVVKEFRTGKVNPGRGRRAIEDLKQLQQDLGRDIHPIVVGGAQFIEQVAVAFKNFTLIDSTPAMKALKRRRLALRNNGLLDR